MQCHHRARCQRRGKQIEIFFASSIRMITVDPQQSDRPLPLHCHLSRKRPVRLHVFFHSCRLQRRQKFLIRRRQILVLRSQVPQSRVRINCHHSPPPESRRNRRQHHRRFPLKAPDFYHRANRWRQRRQRAQESQFVVPQKPWHTLRQRKPIRNSLINFCNLSHKVYPLPKKYQSE